MPCACELTVPPIHTTCSTIYKKKKSNNNNNNKIKKKKPHSYEISTRDTRRFEYLFFNGSSVNLYIYIHIVNNKYNKNLEHVNLNYYSPYADNRTRRRVVRRC